MDQNSRKQVQLQYSKSGKRYDDVRLRTSRGKLLSDYDVSLFERLLPKKQGKMKVLEVGAGTGRFTLPALKRNYDLIATDINETMLDELWTKIEESGFSDRCEAHKEDVFKLSFPENQFDYVFCLHLIPRLLNLTDQRAALSELSRVLKPKGRLLFNYRNAHHPYSLFYKQHSAKPSQINEILEDRGMQIIEKRGKLFLSRKLLNLLPLLFGRAVARINRVLEKHCPDLAWDVFVVAVKQSAESTRSR